MNEHSAQQVWAQRWVAALVQGGVTDVCIAPGSRSTPLVLACAGNPDLTCHVHLDERSAAFFALGLGKATGRPAAVVTTSGTAAANLLPAVVEAAQSETPLLLLTADRPTSLRGADANQAIDQNHLFGRYPVMFFELPEASSDAGALRHVAQVAARACAAAQGPPPGPVHVNLPFRKPLEPSPGLDSVESAVRETTTIHAGERAPGEAVVDGLRQRLERAERGLLIAGPEAATSATAEAALALAAATGFPLLADPLSGARFGNAPQGASVLAHYDLVLRSPSAREALRPDVIVRTGSSPTSARLLTALEEWEGVPHVLLDAGRRWKDHLCTSTEVHMVAPNLMVGALLHAGGAVGRPPQRHPALGLAQGGARRAYTDLWVRLERAAEQCIADVLESGSEACEGAVARATARALPEDGMLFVSNSMPIRDVDANVPAGPPGIRVLGNRGASGIDGIVSSALGAARGSGAPTIALLGDLAFYHDMNGLLAARSGGIDCTFVIVHNDGGGIFHELPIRAFEPEFTTYFATPHGLDFSHAAALYGLAFERVLVTDLEERLRASVRAGGVALIEVRTDREKNREARARLVERVQAAVAKELEAGT